MQQKLNRSYNEQAHAQSMSPHWELQPEVAHFICKGLSQCSVLHLGGAILCCILVLTRVPAVGADMCVMAVLCSVFHVTMQHFQLEDSK